MSASTTRFICPRSSINPSVHAQSVNECPEPTARTGIPAAAAEPTISLSSDSVDGRSIRSGAQRCSRAQFVQSWGTSAGA